MKLFFSVLILITCLSCAKKKQDKVDVSNISVAVTLKPFHEAYFNTNSDELPALKKTYPYLFPANTTDSIWLQKIVEEKPLFLASQKVFGNFSNQLTDLEKLFKHIKYHHPSFTAPIVHTLITGMDYDNKVLYNKKLLFISLDLYLGEKSEFYEQFPLYLSKNFNKKKLVVDVAEAITSTQFQPENNRQFIAKMVSEGKKLFLMKKYLPEISSHLLIGYTPKEFEWVERNETMIWKYFIDNKLIYSTNSDLHQRFIATAPFSKFYLEIDNDSPGSVGKYLGWRVVEAYAKKNNVSITALLKTDALTIFKKSNYKPQKRTF